MVGIYLKGLQTILFFCPLIRGLLLEKFSLILSFHERQFSKIWLE